MISRLLVAFALVSSLFLSVSGQTCGGAGYDLSSANVDLSLVSGSYTWRIRACGVVNNTGAGACVGNVCQGGTVVSSYDPQAATWYAVSGGVVQSLANGAAACGGPRRSNIFFQCNSTATTPFFSAVTEPISCQYNSVVQTAAACTPTGNTAAVYVGATRASTVCGGGFVDFTTLNANDIRGNSGGQNYSVRLCGLTNDPACASVQPSSICQMPSGGVYNLATYNLTAFVPIYTVTSNGLNMQQQTGASCGSFLRYTNVSLSCNPSATTPVLTSVTEPQTCRYNIAIQTNQVCNILNAVPASSSSGTVVVVPVSSSTGVAGNGSVAASSSSSGAANVTVVGSSSSTGAANGTVARSSSSSAAVVGNVTGSSSSSGGGIIVVPSASSSSSSGIASVVASSSSSSGIITPPVASSSSSSPAPTPLSSSARSSSASQSSSAVSSSAVPLTQPSSSSSSAAPVVTPSSSSLAPVVVVQSSSSSAAGGQPPVIIGNDTSSTGIAPPVEFITSSSSSDAGNNQPPTIVNGAESFSPSIIAMIVAIIVAIVGQF